MKFNIHPPHSQLALILIGGVSGLSNKETPLFLILVKERAS